MTKAIKRMTKNLYILDSQLPGMTGTIWLKMYRKEASYLYDFDPVSNKPHFIFEVKIQESRFEIFNWKTESN